MSKQNNKQDAYQRAMANKAKANSINNEEVKEELPWQAEGRVEESVYEEVEDNYSEEVVEDQPLPDSVQTPVEKPLSSTMDVNAILNELTGPSQAIFATILQYIKDMAPGVPMTASVGAIHQQRLWNVLKMMYNNLPVDEFNKLYKILLQLVHEHKDGVFHDDYIFRFAPDWPMSEEDVQAFRSLITLMLITADPRTRRQQLNNIKGWNHILGYGITEEAKNKIRNFYSL